MPTPGNGGILDKVVTATAVVAAIYHILYVGHIFEYLGIYIMEESHRGFHVAFVLALIYLLMPATKRASKRRSWYCVVQVFMSIIVPLYIAFTYKSNFVRWVKLDLTDIEIGLGVVATVSLFEATRRTIGLAMPLLAATFVAYAVYGDYAPGFFHHAGFDFKTVVSKVVYSDQGIFGFITEISATLIIMFVLFGQFLVVSGGGDFFIKLAYVLMGRYRGGPAKIAIVASALFGMISGSTVANVATTGTFTIPLMKRLGYKPSFAGAVEATASNGGQFTPPVMGAVAFVMAQWLEISYWSVCVAAAIPAFLYYFSLYLYVDLEAIRLRLVGLPPSEIPSLKETLKEGWVFVLPVASLVFFIAWMRYLPETSVLYSIGMVTLLISIKRYVGAPKN